ncbi:MAG: LysM peptidoglycan-binding domain-containing M23 family metallopeptidase [Methyloligellaceae bacterium]
MRFRSSGLIMAGGLLFMSAGLASCSSSVTRFDYPLFAASEKPAAGSQGQRSDDTLTTASVRPVPEEPVYQEPAYRGGGSSTVVKSELPPPAPAYSPAPAQGPVAPYSQPPAQTAVAPPQRVEPMPLPPKAPAPEPLVVTVKRGDTLSAIARKHDVTVQDIMSANELKSTRLSLNQKLVIPGKHAPKPVPRTASVYRVKKGDTLSLIAKRHGITYRELAQHNGLKETAVLQLGQELKIPGEASGAKKGPVRVASRGDAVPLPPAKPRSSPGRTATPAVATKPSGRKVAARKTLPPPKAMSGNQFRWPVRGRIISGFGAKPNGKHNDGINVAVPLGTPVKAAENGVVAYAGSELEGYGNLVLIRHANNWVTAYAHNDRILVKRGDEVRRGQIIGKAGKTGSVSQPQLHFELRKGSQPVNPLKYMSNG